jgi:hypothetical protein
MDVKKGAMVRDTMLNGDATGRQQAFSTPETRTSWLPARGNCKFGKRVVQTSPQSLHELPHGPAAFIQWHDGTDRQLARRVEYTSAASADPLDFQPAPPQFFVVESNMAPGTASPDGDDWWMLAEQQCDAGTRGARGDLDQLPLQLETEMVFDFR